MSKTPTKTPDRRMDGDFYDALKGYLEQQPLGQSFMLWKELQSLPELEPPAKPAKPPRKGKTKAKPKPALVPSDAADSDKTAEGSE